MKIWAKKTGLGLIIFLSVISQILAGVLIEEYTFRGGNKEDRAQYFRQPLRFWGAHKYPEDTSFTGRLFVMNTGFKEFALWCPGRIIQDTGKWYSIVTMKRPSNANWAVSPPGFYVVKINGKENIKYEMVVDDIQEGDKGVVGFSWKHPDALVTVKFIALANDDKLLVETSIKPNREINNWLIELRCYPSSYGINYKGGIKERDREALTPERILIRPKKEDNRGWVKVTLTEKEPWVLFYDKYFDVSRNEEIPEKFRGHKAEGPCAAAYLPEEVSKAWVAVENYCCYLRLQYPGTVKRSHIILWDFHNMTNKEAIDYMKKLELKEELP